MGHETAFYISGDHDFTLKDDEIVKLRTYIQRGGMLVGNADACSAQFTASFRSLATQLFPTYESRVLMEDHPILANQQYVSTALRNKPRIEGTSNDVRELIILFPNDDPGRWMHNRAFAMKPESFQAMANILLYAIDKTLHRPRLTAEEPKTILHHSNKELRIARLKYVGNWNPEPASWETYARSRDPALPEVVAETLDLRSTEIDVKKFPIAQLTGTTKFRLSPEEAKHLSDYIKSGGTLLVDSAAGSGTFSNLTLEAITQLGLSAEDPQPVAQDSVVYMTPKPVAFTTIRPFCIRVGNANVGRLKVLRYSDRPAIYISETDLTAGLLGLRHDGILGLRPAATR